MAIRRTPRSLGRFLELYALHGQSRGTFRANLSRVRGGISGSHNSGVHRLLPLLKMVNGDSAPGESLDRLAVAALELTGSRNSMIAFLNDENGVLDLEHGAGPEWTQTEIETIDVTTRSGIVAYVAATGKKFVSGDVANEPQYRNLFSNTRSEMAVPVIDRHGRMRGVFNVESDRPNAYDDNSVTVLNCLAGLATVVINQKDATTREDALVEIGHALDKAFSQDEVVKFVIRIAGEVLRFGAFSVFLFDPASDLFVLRGSVGQLKDRVGQLSYRRGEGITGWVAETAQPILTHDPSKDPRWLGKNVEFPSEQIASFLAVPVVHRGRCIGVLRVLRKFSENAFLDNRFTLDDERVLTTIAEQMASALENVRSLDRLLRSERMAAWGELSAKSSHMIGNRVFALKGDVNELGHLLGQPELARTSIEELHKSLVVNVLRVEEILQEFRDFLTATQLETEPGDVNDLVETTTKEIFPRRSPVSLEFTLTSDLPRVNMDPKRLRRAISELVENSMNYVTAGSLKVGSSLADVDAKKKGRVPTASPFVQIVVEDTGPGVEDDKKATIFQPFFSGRVKGMGLGLSIVKGIIEAHGGAVFEDGELGRGAKFVILLPALERS